MSNIDDLRQFDEEPDIEFDASVFEQVTTVENPKFMGMTAIERMFAAIFLFLAVLVACLAALIVTGRVVL